MSRLEAYDAMSSRPLERGLSPAKSALLNGLLMYLILVLHPREWLRCSLANSGMSSVKST
jgi:hypothetical protein